MDLRPVVLRTSKRNNPQRQHGRDKAAGMKNLKSAFFLGHPLCSWLHFCACFSLIMWSPGPRCTAVEANFGGREGDRGQARPLARLCRPPALPPTDLLDNPEVDLALAACRWPAPALAWQTLLASPTSPLPLGPPPPSPTSPL